LPIAQLRPGVTTKVAVTLRANGCIVVYEKAGWIVIELVWASSDISEDIPEDVDGAAPHRLQADAHIRIRYSVIECADVPMRKVQFKPIVAGPENIVAIEIY
jgi:hypothetical protein